MRRFLASQCCMALALVALAVGLAACQGPGAEVAQPTTVADDSAVVAQVAAKAQTPPADPMPQPLLAFMRPPKALDTQADTLEYAVAHAADSLLQIPLESPHSIAAWNRMAQQVDSMALAPYSAADFVPQHLARLYERAPQRVLLWICNHPHLSDNRLATLLPAIETLTVEQMKDDVDLIDDSLTRRTLYAILPIDVHLSINASENDLQFYQRELRRIEQTRGAEALDQFNTLVVKWNMDESINLLTATLYDDFCHLTRRLYLRSPSQYLLWVYDHRNTLAFAHRDHLSDMLLAAAQSTRRLSLRHIHQAIDQLDIPAPAREYLHLRF